MDFGLFVGELLFGLGRDFAIALVIVWVLLAALWIRHRLTHPPAARIEYVEEPPRVPPERRIPARPGERCASLAEEPAEGCGNRAARQPDKARVA